MTKKESNKDPLILFLILLSFSPLLSYPFSQIDHSKVFKMTHEIFNDPTLFKPNTSKQFCYKKKKSFFFFSLSRFPTEDLKEPKNKTEEKHPMQRMVAIIKSYHTNSDSTSSSSSYSSEDEMTDITKVLKATSISSHNQPPQQPK